MEYSRQAIKQAISDYSEVLVKASTVFTLEKTTVTLTRTKLVIEKRLPLGTVNVISGDVDDITNVNASIGPFFGTITIDTEFTAQGKTYNIGLFLRKDTIRIKRIIQGRLVVAARKIDISELPIEELVDLLYRLGTDDPSVKA